MEQSTKENASIKMLPLFYELSLEDCKNPPAQWCEKWNQFAAKDSNVFNADNCKNALRNLSSACAGVEFDQGNYRTKIARAISKLSCLSSWKRVAYDQTRRSEVEYRTKIIQAICKLIRPDYWDEQGVQGTGELCKMVADKFHEGGKSYNDSGALALGLHGPGGIGKTTICRAMCGYYYGEFSGNVWHLQLPSNPTSEADVVKQLLLVLEKLTEADVELLKPVSTIREVGVYLKKRMTMKRSVPVFLAIDNVWDVNYSMDAARSVLQAGFGEGSKVLVTARSKDVLEKLLGPHSCHMDTPAIGENDALGILFNHADTGCKLLSDLSDDQRSVLNAVVEHSHRHPLALKIFGDVLKQHGEEVSAWRKILEKLQQNRRSKDEDPVQSIIQAGYDELSPELKLVFLDVAVFLRLFLQREEISINDASDWLNTVHRSHESNGLVFEGMDRLRALQKFSFLEGKMDKDSRLQIHDLIKDYAVKEVEEGKSAESRCLWFNKDSDHEGLAALSTEAWSKLERMALVDCGSVKLQWDRGTAVKALYEEEEEEEEEEKNPSKMNRHSDCFASCQSAFPIRVL